MASTPAARPRRSVWWVVHHWAGLKLGLLLSFVLATGTLATVANEIDWLATPAMRVWPRDAAMASWGRLYAAASVPGATVEELRAPIEIGFAVRATIRTGEGERRLVHIDPWTAQVQGIGPSETFQDVVRDLHRELMLPGWIGIPLVGLLSIPLLATLVTAFKVHKKWWRGFARWPRPMRDRRREMRRYVGDLHRLAGLWSLGFLALVGATGLWYLAERFGAEAPAIEPPAIDKGRSRQAPGANELDAMIAVARAASPGFIVRGVTIADGIVTIEGQTGSVLVRDRASAAWFAVEDQRLLGRTASAAMSAHQRIGEAADPLHFGTLGRVAEQARLGRLWIAADHPVRHRNADLPLAPRRRRSRISLARAIDGPGRHPGHRRDRLCGSTAILKPASNALGCAGHGNSVEECPRITSALPKPSGHPTARSRRKSVG